jgi:hypothetical protein
MTLDMINTFAAYNIEMGLVTFCILSLVLSVVGAMVLAWMEDTSAVEDISGWECIDGEWLLLEGHFSHSTACQTVEEAGYRKEVVNGVTIEIEESYRPGCWTIIEDDGQLRFSVETYKSWGEAYDKFQTLISIELEQEEYAVVYDQFDGMIVPESNNNDQFDAESWFVTDDWAELEYLWAEADTLQATIDLLQTRYDNLMVRIEEHDWAA